MERQQLGSMARLSLCLRDPRSPLTPEPSASWHKMAAAPRLKSMNHFQGKKRERSSSFLSMYDTLKREEILPRSPLPQQMSLMSHGLQLSHMLMPQPMTGKGVDPWGQGPPTIKHMALRGADS